MTTIHTLTQRAMVTTLNIGVWKGYRHDKAASAKVTSDSGAHADAARVNKHLIPKEALKPVEQLATQIRQHFYDNTLPWRDNGDRLMTRMLYLKFVPEHEKLVGEFNRAVDKFLDHAYPSAVAQAEFRMGELFKHDDYPRVEELRSRFYARMGIDAIATADDFRVQLDQEYVDKVKEAMTKAAEERIQQAMGDVWKRLAETVGYFFERMDTPDAIFRDSTVTNIAELVELIPGLNVLDDPDIERVRQMVQKKLTGTDAKDIRQDPTLRAELAGDAKEILDTMSGFIKAFGAGDA